MNVVLTLYVVALALLAWFSVFKIVPSCTVSLFRHRLWRMRDKVADEIRGGTFEDTEQPKRYVALLEGAIEAAPELSPLNLLLARLTWTDSMKKLEQLPLRLDDLAPTDRAVLEKHLEELHNAVLTQMLFGTPSGWLVSLVATPLVAAAVLRDRFRRDKGGGGSFLDHAKSHVADDFEMDPALALMSRRTGRRRRGSLYHYV